MPVELTQADREQYTILIVDDVVSNVLLLKVLLSKEKYNILTASGGKEAIAITMEKKPDLILLDVMMPEITGFEVAQKLKDNPETSQIPIIFLTALNSTEDIVNGFHAGANDFITKPFNKEELLVRVNHQISLVAAKRLILQRTEELRRTIVGRDKLYSVIAHDLRSPLASIKMVLNMLVLTLSKETLGQEKEIWVDVNEDNESTVTNAGNTTSRPILTIYGQGDIGVYINDVEVLDIALGDEEYITLDSVEMEAYKDTTANLKNRLVTGDYSKLALNAGDNKIRFTGKVTKYEISKYSRWL